jgi:hypothetical protein
MRPPLPLILVPAALLLLRHIYTSQLSLHSQSLPTFVQHGGLSLEAFRGSQMLLEEPGDHL